jgi:hypothetical protein
MTNILSSISLVRVFAVGTLALATSMILTVLVVVAYAFVLGFEARGQPDQARIEQFAKAVAPWLGPILASILAACGAAWVAARVHMHLIMHGLLVGAVVGMGVLAIELSQGMGPADVAKVLPVLAAAWLGSALVARRTSQMI